MRFQWLGATSFALELGRFRLLGDPLLLDAGTTGPIPGREEEPDRLLVSRCPPLPRDGAGARRTDRSTPVIAPPAFLATLAAMRFEDIVGLGWWSEVRLAREGESLSITAVPTRRRPGASGDSNGYVLEHSVGDSVYAAYWTGDTAWFDAITEIRDFVVDADLLVLEAPGEDPFRVVAAFAPAVVIAIPRAEADPAVRDELARWQLRLRQSGYAGEIVVPEPGVVVER